MSSPERAWPVWVALALILATAGCATTRGGGRSVPPPLSEARSGGVELVGTARGPLPGMGPEARVHAFLRNDAAARVEVRYRPEEGAPVHEVLVWTHDTALLFDRRTGRFTDMGERPGRFEAEGGSFEVADLVWVLTGRVVGGTDHGWERSDGEFRRRGERRGWRRPVTRPLEWSELVWRAGGEVRTIRTEVEAHEGSGSDALPRRLRIDFPGLEAPVVVDWSRIRTVPAMGDSILDPLWEP